jgi:hypothetical protein
MKLGTISSHICAGILDQSMGARNRVRIGMSYRSVRLHLAESIPGLLKSLKIPGRLWNPDLLFIKIKQYTTYRHFLTRTNTSEYSHSPHTWQNIRIFTRICRMRYTVVTQTFSLQLNGQSFHGLTNNIDTVAKCRHLKKLTVKGTLALRQVFFRVYRLEIVNSQSCWYFDPALWTINLLSGATLHFTTTGKPFFCRASAFPKIEKNGRWKACPLALLWDRSYTVSVLIILLSISTNLYLIKHKQPDVPELLQ